MKFVTFGAALLPLVACVELNTDDEASIKKAAAGYAKGLMSLYKNGAAGSQQVGTFGTPYYWWEAGAAWGGMIEYTQFTEDSTYTETLQTALAANFGPANDLIVPWQTAQEGNDDQAFWALTVMSAVEYGFPQADGAASYLEVVENSFNNIASRWALGGCDGGLKWQIYTQNSYGYNYKNSISNGAFFALAARLAAHTGNQTYLDWASKAWDWTEKIGFITDKYAVYDGAAEDKSCTVPDVTEWSYNLGVFLHGSAAMYSVTKGDSTWQKRVSGLLDHAQVFFKSGVMYEQACETGANGRTCNLDQQSFKAYLARFMAKTAVLAPFTKDTISKYIASSATAAAKTTSGDGTCGSKWYTGSYDGTSGVGQQLSALEVTQALLTLKGVSGGSSSDSSSSAAPSSTPTPKASSAAAASSSSAPQVSSVTVSSAAAASSTPSAPGTAASGSAGSVAVPVASGSVIASSYGASSPSSAANAASTNAAGGVFGEKTSSCTTFTTTTTVYVPPSTASSTSCTETPTTTKTVYVQPSTSAAISSALATGGVATPPAVPSASTPSGVAPYPSGNGTTPASPSGSLSANATTPGVPQFTGAASSLRTTGFSVVGAVALALLGGLF